MMGDMTGTVMNWSVTHWAIGTFAYTGLLIAAVLMLRQPVARLFGPRIAYALWLLPLARFVMPPIVLPAWMRPAEIAAAPEPVAMAVPGVVEAAAMPAVATDPAFAWDMLIDAGLVVWLVGAMLFLGWRIACYRTMTRHLQAGARPVGDAGPIRLIESPAVAAPVAFGVRDRVIALPIGFMAGEDIAARDFAIAHEIAHHRGHDLLANLVAQPVLALHWFNPLAWLGWRAMRRDQEAACDARVIAGRGQEERAHYGAVIAACSREQNLALAAPMAGFREIGPVLGEKAIVHRLRSLGMTTTTRRHRTGLLLLGATALIALPATVSVSYAEPEVVAIERTEVPASTAVEEPVVEVEEDVRVGHMDEDGQIEWIVEDDMSEAEEAELERAMAEADRAMERAEREAERAEWQAERAEERAEREAERAQREYERRAIAIERQVHRIERSQPQVEHEVRDGGKVQIVRITHSDTGADGKQMVRKMVIDSRCTVDQSSEDGDTKRVCTGVPHDMMINAMEQARESISAAKGMDAGARAEALAEIDAQIARMKAERDKS